MGHCCNVIQPWSLKALGLTQIHIAIHVTQTGLFLLSQHFDFITILLPPSLADRGLCFSIALTERSNFKNRWGKMAVRRLICNAYNCQGNLGRDSHKQLGGALGARAASTLMPT